MSFASLDNSTMKRSYISVNTSLRSFTFTSSLGLKLLNNRVALLISPLRFLISLDSGNTGPEYCHSSYSFLSSSNDSSISTSVTTSAVRIFAFAEKPIILKSSWLSLSVCIHSLTYFLSSLTTYAMWCVCVSTISTASLSTLFVGSGMAYTILPTNFWA